MLFSSIIPVFIEVIRPFFLISSYWKLKNDPALNGTFSRKLNKIESLMAMENLSVTKFVNY